MVLETGLKNCFPDDLMLREEILAVLDSASAQTDCSYYYRLYKKIVG